MAVSYKRLWKLLVDKEMSKSDLRRKAEIAPNTMTKLRRDEEVSLTILSKICKTINYDIYNEQALDMLTFPYNNGFVGTYSRVFNPASYKYAYVEDMKKRSYALTSM